MPGAESLKSEIDMDVVFISVFTDVFLWKKNI